eukprot:CAMPEP_0204523734 /NCGR_PEP_ID=MMETSP0661-20131031/6999_1 /ASSEMBLY_ACC=CAM_ASM_000606 /TAXON_ID=109239 /ORGANISM="Alexandrium margalefi, Strain AMGDE01CS-322" /LENGTH=207 /DNA_ID=CAMNT_0051529447 /DNA_START=19 /DNA_END=639 /DNA_ORIENTATION=-
MKRARTRDNFATAVQRALIASREMSSVFMFRESSKEKSSVSLCLEEDGQVQLNEAPKQVKASGTSAFWHFTDEEFMMLIGMSAQALVKTYPFCDHPANKEPEALRRQRSKSPGNAAAQQAASTFKLGDASGGVPIGRLRIVAGRGQLQKGPGAKAPAVPKGVDIDEVFRRFTPRLLDISEEQDANPASPSRAIIGLQAVEVPAGGCR